MNNINNKKYPITLIILLLFFLLIAQATARGQSSSSTASRIRSGTSDPATCTTTGSNIFYRSDTGALKVCSATNTWTALSSTTGTVTSVSVTTANGVSGSVANATTTPAITLTLGAIVPTSVNSVVISGASTPTLAVTGTSTISGTNTGDQTSVSGNAGTATALQTARTIGGVSFDGTANITVATATGGFTVSGGDLALGANNLTLTGSIAATGARVTKGWFTDVESTNMYTVGGVSLNSTFAPIASPTFTGTVTIPTPFTLGATSVTSTGTQLNYLNAATGTTGTTSTNVVFSASPTFTGTVSGAALTLSSDITLTGTGRRFIADMSTAGNPNRFSFQTSTTNGSTVMGIISNGSSTTAAVRAFAGSDSANANFGGLLATNTGMAIESSAVGTGVTQNLILRVGASDVLTLTATSGTPTGNVKIMGTAARATTEGTNHLDIFDGTAPVGTLANGISLYSTSGELRVMDAGGTPTLLSPHDSTNQWIFDSYTGLGKNKRRIIIDMERLVKFLDSYFGTNFVHEYTINGMIPIAKTAKARKAAVAAKKRR